MENLTKINVISRPGKSQKNKILKIHGKIVEIYNLAKLMYFVGKKMLSVCFCHD